MRIASIDIGTNTALLLVADTNGRALAVVHDQTRAPRLGQGVDGTGRLAQDAIGRVLDALAGYRAQAVACGAEVVVATATSAARDAANRDELCKAARELGVPLRVLSGAEEAEMTLAGGLSGFPELARAAVLDIGGGSTELALGTRDQVAYAASVQIGTVRLTERLMPTRPARSEELAAACAMVDRELARLEPPTPPHPLLALAGTPCALAALDTGRTLAELEGLELTHDAVQHWSQRLAALTAAEALALAPEALAGRADVILAGALILERVMTHFGVARCRVSGRGVRHGVALWAARRGGELPW